MHKLYSALIWRQIGQAQSLLPTNDWDCIQFCMIIQYNTSISNRTGENCGLKYTDIEKKVFKNVNYIYRTI